MRISDQDFALLKRLFKDASQSADLSSIEYEEVSKIPNFQELFLPVTYNGEYYYLQLTEATFKLLNLQRKQ